MWECLSRLSSLSLYGYNIYIPILEREPYAREQPATSGALWRPGLDVRFEGGTWARHEGPFGPRCENWKNGVSC